MPEDTDRRLDDLEGRLLLVEERFERGLVMLEETVPRIESGLLAILAELRPRPSKGPGPRAASGAPVTDLLEYLRGRYGSERDA